MTLITFDPGQTTGWSIWENDLLTAWGQFTCENLLVLEALITPKSSVVYESLTWKNPAFNPVGMEVIGAIKLRCLQCGVAWASQPPSILTGVQKWPIYKWKGLSPHEKDAIGHGIMALGYKVAKLPKQFLKEV